MNHDYDSDSTNGKNNSGIFKLPYNVMLDSVMEGENVFAGRMSVVWQGMWRYDQVGLAATAEKIRTSRLPGGESAFSLCFSFANVDSYNYNLIGPSLHTSNKNSPIFDAIKSGKYPLMRKKRRMLLTAR